MTVRDLMEMVCDHCFGDLNWCGSHTKEVCSLCEQ